MSHDPPAPGDEVVLTGGNATPVVRRGDTVRRGAGEWTPTVQALLAHVRARGVTEVPEPRGLDADGREVLSYLDGEVPSDGPLPAWLWDEQVLVEAARLIRRFHDATVGFLATAAGGPEPVEAPVWRMPAHDPVEVVCHNDVAPYNLVFRGGHLVGLIDHDHASPGPRVWDLAYLAYRLVPLQAPTNPDHPGGAVASHRDRRLAVLCDSYGPPAPDEAWRAVTPDRVLAVLPARLADLRAYTAARAADDPDGPLTDHLAIYDADLAYLGTL